MNTTSLFRQPTELISEVRTTLESRRTRREAQRELRRDLASYTSDAEINDLLALLDSHDDAEADVVRSILLDNRRATSGARWAS